MTLTSIGEVTIPKNYLCLLINQSLSIDKIKNKKEQMLRAPYEDSKKIVLFFFNFFSVASWVVERGTGFSDMDAGMWLVSAFFKIEYWNFQDKLFLWFREASQNLNLFRQLFISWLPKKKCWKIAKIIRCFFQHFSFGPPTGSHERSIAWNFFDLMWPHQPPSKRAPFFSKKLDF